MSDVRREFLLALLFATPVLSDVAVSEPEDEAVGGDEEESKLVPRGCPPTAAGLSLRRNDAKRFTAPLSLLPLPLVLPLASPETGERARVDPAFVTVGRASAVDGE